MKCPGCGLYHPPQFERCMSCGALMHGGQAEPPAAPVEAHRQSVSDRVGSADASGAKQIQAPARHDRLPEPDSEEEDQEETPKGANNVSKEAVRKPARRSKVQPSRSRNGVPVILGSMMFFTVLLVFAGATVFYLTKPPDDERLYREGVKELSDGQFAFAVKSLDQATALRPKDARIFLALARAYVGIDQVDKAWECVSQAQQLGAGVASDPGLASELANYYRQRAEYEKAINLLRPLAKADVPGKKAELADLDAMWGDDSLRDGKLDLALRCWEEVRDLRDGSRSGEAESRLATIYQRLANTYASDSNKENDADALKYLNKLNNIAQNPKNYEMAADLYERKGELELAIDQMRKACKLSGKNEVLDRKLASLLSRRGKELLDEGNTDEGYGYLQQAKTVSADSSIPPVALRNLSVSLDRYTRMPQISGEVWNPTDNSVNALTMKVELFDTIASKVVWTKDQRVVDEFVAALGAHESKPFEISSAVPAKNDGTAEFRVYLDGSLYKTYPIGTKKGEESGGETASTPTRGLGAADYRGTQRRLPTLAPKETTERQTIPPVAPPIAHEQPIAPASAPTVSTPQPAKSQTPAEIPTTTPRSGSSSAEEKTMKDLDQ